MSANWYKENATDKVWWLDNGADVKGEFIFSFDKKKQYNLFEDYPHALSPDERAIFDKENPYWQAYFFDRG